MFIRRHEALGTHWCITICDTLPEATLDSLYDDLLRISKDFQDTYSRFDDNSLLSKLSEVTGTRTVTKDFVKILEIYNYFYIISNKKINPLIADTLSDLGYDRDYSLKTKSQVREVPDFPQNIKILSEETIEIKKITSFDFGAIGKGYLIDLLSEYLKSKNIKKFAVDGSGDIYYYNQMDRERFKVGLEHPLDKSQIIGTVEILNESICSSAITRRAWANSNHYVDPDTRSSPQEILATWAIYDSAAMADGFASTLFFYLYDTVADNLSQIKDLKYLTVNKNLEIAKSDKWDGEIFE